MNLSFHFILTTIFIVCFVFSLLINYILLRFAQTLGMRNRELHQQVRWNLDSKPSLGGISFYVVFLFAFIFTIILPHQNAGFNIQIIGILLSATLAFLMGLADDAFNTQPLLKFLTQIFCALILIFSGHSIHIFENLFLNYLITILWVVGLMNSINMLDNMDGISCLVSILGCFFMVAVNVSLFNTNSYATTLNLGVLGALCGFLVFNFHPSKMFMGDTGSQFLGLFLAVMGIDNCWNNPTSPLVNGFPIANIVIVVLVFLLPLTDTITVVINRLKEGRSPFIGGKDHTTHHLFFRGLTEKRIALLFFGLGDIGILMAYLLVVRFSYTLFYSSIFFVLLVFFSLYLLTIVKKKS
ncbi:MraY family glycosyltransferase [Aurantibacillus circumpalustris]|uniref:MraY family glycosyltransferase n=1 Tax=Aurantibacillus circumpalustris TaxID=3036359 RepID=UPI00295AAE61|nr:MraY family glycosyltransferase [Aurantibacillus circumpalustris]